MSQEENPTVRLLSYRELILTLQGLCREKRSGVMVINSELGDIAKLTLEQGTIFDVIFGGVSGTAALSLIKKIKQGKASFFRRTQGSAVQHIDLSTDNILQLLANAEPITEQPVAHTVIADHVVPSQVVSEENLMVIEAILATIIGPVARIIYSEYKEEIQRVDDLDVLGSVIEKIAKQVLVAEQQTIFREYIREFIYRCSLKGQKSILNTLKSADRESRLSSTVLSLCIKKGVLGATLLAKLALQIQYAGNLAGVVKIIDILRFLEKTTETGLLAIEAKGKKAGFYFEQGVLINAFDADRHGVKVALELLQWEPDKMMFIMLSQTGVAREIHQAVDSLVKQIEDSYHIISKEQGLEYAKTDKVALSANEIQVALAKEIQRLQTKATDKKESAKRAEIDIPITKAIQLAESYDNIRAEQLLCYVLLNHDDNYKGWLWLARVLTNMTAIEFALKKAAYIDSKSSELAEDVKKFTMARKVIKSDFVLRCPFCWMPVKEKANECSYCAADFFIERIFFSQVGKAKTDVLDKAITRYNNALQQNASDSDNVYLHFYLAMAYLNREYYQEGLAQLNEAVNISPENQALIRQSWLLTKYMQSVGLISTPSRQSSQSAALTKGRILVVEDSMVTRKVIARTLMAQGYEVLEAKDADEALTDIEARNPNLVLLDIILPGRSGYEILAEIRKMPRLAKVPIIMLTSRDSLFDKLKGKVSDANEYLTKPFQPDELLAIVKKYVT